MALALQVQHVSKLLAFALLISLLSALGTAPEAQVQRQALSMSGEGFVTLPDATALDISGDPITVGVWVKHDGQTDADVILVNKSAGGVDSLRREYLALIDQYLAATAVPDTSRAARSLKLALSELTDTIGEKRYLMESPEPTEAATRGLSAHGLSRGDCDTLLTSRGRPVAGFVLVRLAQEAEPTGERARPEADPPQTEESEVLFDLSSVTLAEVRPPIRDSTFAVTLSFTDAGSACLEAVMREHAGEQLDVVISGERVRSPRLLTALPAGRVTVVEASSKARAERLARSISERLWQLVGCKGQMSAWSSAPSVLPGDAGFLRVHRVVEPPRDGTDQPTAQVDTLTLEGTEEWLVLKEEPFFDLSVVRHARMHQHPDGRYSVVADIKEHMIPCLDKAWSQHVGERIGVVIDGQLAYAPRMMAALPGSTVPVQHGLRREEAARLAEVINERL